PVNLDRLKAAVQARWGTVDLLDFLAEADHHVGLLDCFPSVATREATPPELLRERLLLVLFALVIWSRLEVVHDVPDERLRSRVLPAGRGYLPPSSTRVPGRFGACAAGGDRRVAA
ncbi:MAG: hypothetical protein ACXV5Q_12465, partial [Frankiaceae bacterium]